MYRPKGTKGLYLLVLAFGLVSLSSGYDADKLYNYDFQGAVLTKIANDDKPQYSGISFKSSVLVKKSGDKELTVKLDKPQSALFNDVMQNVHTYNYEYKPIDAKSEKGLDRPFRIYFDENNSVKALDLYKDEPVWVSNFKRGLLSFFQLNLKSKDDSSSYFAVEENSVFGACETDYIVLSNQDSLNVTKTRNMANCKSRYLDRFMPVDAKECIEGESEKQQYKHSNAVFNFNLKGNKDNHHIERVILDEQATFSPFGPRAHSHMLHTKFMLQLNKVDDSAVPEVEANSEKSESLAYKPAGGDQYNDFYAPINMESKHHLSNIYKTDASVEQVVTAFDVLVEEHRKYVGNAFNEAEGSVTNFQENSRLAEYYAKLSSLVGLLSYQEVEQLYNQVDERGEGHKKVFWDLMSIVGTNPSFMFMKKLITEGEAPSVRIKDYLPQISFHLKQPSKALFDEYLNLCKSDKIQTQQQYKRTCSLPLASLIHQHCVKPNLKYKKMKETAPKTVCQLSTAEEYFSKLVSKPEADASISDKMFAIKIAGELGVKPTLDMLAEVIKNRDEHPTLRAAAMWNLIKVSHLFPKEVKKLVIPYYYDQNELLEMRLAAFYNWMDSGITLHELELLGKQLMLEQNRQLVLYMNSLMTSISKLHSIPCATTFKRTAGMVVPLIKKALTRHAPGSFWESQAQVSSTWQPDFGYGTMSMMSVIYNNNSVAPTNLFYRSAEIMSGFNFVPMTVSVQAHNMDKLIKRVFGSSGLFAGKDSFLDVFSLKKRAKRFADGSTKPEFSDVYIAATVMVYGRPVMFLDIDSKELKKMMSEDGTIKIPHIKKLLHSFNNHSSPHMMIKFEKMEVFNNEMGLPLYQSIIDFDYKNFKLNTVKVDVEPGFFKDERQGKPPTRLTAALDAKLVKHNEMFVASGAIMTSEKKKIGAAFYKKKLINVPVKVSIDANLLENKVSIKRQPIHENLLYIKQTPVTFIQSYDPASKLDRGLGGDNQNSWMPLYDPSNESQMKPFRLDYMTPLAIGVKLEGKHKTGMNYSMAAWRKYLSENGMAAAKFNYFYSPTGSPYEVRVSTITTPESENPSKELTTTISWSHHHDGSSSPLNEVEQQLETAVASSTEGKPTTVSYKIDLVGGSTKERKVGLDLAYSRSADRSLHKWRVLYKRTPLDQKAAESVNLCWFGQASSPKYDIKKLLQLDLTNSEHSMNMTSELIFDGNCVEGKSTEAPAKVSMKLASISEAIEAYKQQIALITEKYKVFSDLRGY